MSIYSRHRFSHALPPEQQAEYCTWGRGLRLSGFGRWDSSEDAEKIKQATAKLVSKKEEFSHVEDIPRTRRKRKLVFQYRQTWLDKIKEQYNRALSAARRRFRRRKVDPKVPALQGHLEEEIKRLEKELVRERRSRGGVDGEDYEKLEKELNTARSVARGVREELRRRDTEGL